MLAQPEPEPVEIMAELEEYPEQEVDRDQEAEPEQDPEAEPTYLEDIPEDVVGGTVAKPNSWPWQVETNQQAEANSAESNMRSWLASPLSGFTTKFKGKPLLWRNPDQEELGYDSSSLCGQVRCVFWEYLEHIWTGSEDDDDEEDLFIVFTVFVCHPQSWT